MLAVEAAPAPHSTAWAEVASPATPGVDEADRLASALPRQSSAVMCARGQSEEFEAKHPLVHLVSVHEMRALVRRLACGLRWCSRVLVCGLGAGGGRVQADGDAEMLEAAAEVEREERVTGSSFFPSGATFTSEDAGERVAHSDHEQVWRVVASWSAPSC